jgi:hypothetical protein
MYAENEILFPPYVIPQLKGTRGEVWRGLVERVTQLPEDHPESLAFSLMMIRLDGCLNCETDSYRAMRGCVACAQQTLRRFKAPDEELIERFNKALADVEVFLKVDVQPHRLERVSAQAA